MAPEPWGMGNGEWGIDSTPKKATSRRRLWPWVAALALLLLAGFVGSIAFKKQHALTPEKLAAARARWESAGMEDYDLQVTVSGGTSGVYQLQVRKNAIRRALLNDRPFENLNAALPWTVPELFNILQQDLVRDATPGNPGAFTQVEFDPSDGHLVRYLRQQRAGSRQSILIEVSLSRL